MKRALPSCLLNNGIGSGRFSEIIETGAIKWMNWYDVLKCTLKRMENVNRIGPFPNLD